MRTVVSVIKTNLHVTQLLCLNKTLLRSVEMNYTLQCPSELLAGMAGGENATKVKGTAMSRSSGGSIILHLSV